VRPILRRIVVPLDGSSLSENILGVVANTACSLNARVLLLRAVPPVTLSATNPTTELAYPVVVEDDAATRRLADEAKRQLADVKRLLTHLGCMHIETEVVVASDSARAIVDFARDHEADLIAMSTHGRGVSRLVVGSVADRVLRESGIPVLLSHPHGLRLEPPLLTEAAVAEQLSALTTADNEC
jgi:nucleotide-binding universal stress UspA family protein